MPESSDECAMHDAGLEVAQLLFEDRCSERKGVGNGRRFTAKQVFEPVAPQPGEPSPMKAETGATPGILAGVTDPEPMDAQSSGSQIKDTSSRNCRPL
jgi:hypothetical protein